MTLLDHRPNTDRLPLENEIGIRYDAERRRVAVDGAAREVIRCALRSAGVTIKFPPQATPRQGGVDLLSYLDVYDAMGRLRDKDYCPTAQESAYLNRLSSAACKLSAAAMVAATTEGTDTQLPKIMDEDGMVLFYDAFSQSKMPDVLVRD